MSPQLANALALARRYPFGVTCSVITICTAVTTYFLWQDRDEQELVYQDVSKQGEAMLDLRKGGSTQREELAAVRDATRRIEDNLVIEANLADNKWYFYKMEEQTKVRLLDISQNPAAPGDSSLYRRIPFSARVTGTYEQVASFLLALETGPRLAKITSFNFSRRGPGSDAIALDLTLELLGKK